ncbi:MAG: family 78 glycoside hydrolase catalytic domain, partial [Bacteroidota bacterium]
MQQMTILLRGSCLAAALFSLMVSHSPSQLQEKTTMNPNIAPTELRCEYLVNPLGIDELKPRLSWILEVKDKARGQKQTAYQILVSSSESKLKADEGDLWDSGRVESNQSNQIEYNGKPLTSRARCYWKVRIWDKDNVVSTWSKTAFWSIGLVQPSDWKAQWIGARPIVLSGDRQTDSVARLMAPSPMLRKTFASNKRIVRATMFVTALGLYEVQLNGKKVGDHVLAPEWTDYQDRIQYQTYDVTSLITKGENVISATLADGWYVGPVGCFNDLVVNRGKIYNSLDRKLLLQLEIDTTEGHLEYVISDETWRLNPDGPVRSADLYLGETYDSRKSPEGWERSGFDDSSWERATVYAAPAAAIVAQMNEPVRRTLELNPLAITEPVKGTYIVDMGQNMVGWCAIKINEPAGQEITIRHGEMLTEDGRLYTENLRRASQTDKFIANGKGEQIFEPRFTYHGFRYVEITGLTKKPTLDMVLGKEVSSDVAAAGSFECSNKDLNKLWKNILWTQRDNFIGIPTDCPQRDERLGWMADAQVFAQTAIYNCTMAAFFTKWVQDIRDAQHPDGRYPDVAPVPSYLPFFNAPAWADAGVIVPWRMY